MVEILRSGVVRVVGIARLLLIIASVGTPELRGGRLRALKPGYKRSQKRLGSATIPGTPYEVFLGAAHRWLESTGKSFRQISEARLRCRIGSDRPALCMGIMQPRHEMVVGRAQWRKQGKYGECKSTARVDFRQKCIRRTKKKKKKKRKRGQRSITITVGGKVDLQKDGPIGSILSIFSPHAHTDLQCCINMGSYHKRRCYITLYNAMLSHSLDSHLSFSFYFSFLEPLHT